MRAAGQAPNQARGVIGQHFRYCVSLVRENAISRIRDLSDEKIFNVDAYELHSLLHCCELLNLSCPVLQREPLGVGDTAELHCRNQATPHASFWPPMACEQM